MEQSGGGMLFPPENETHHPRQAGHAKAPLVLLLLRQVNVAGDCHGDYNTPPPPCYSIVKLAVTTARILLSLENVSFIPSPLVSFELREVI